MRPRFSNFRKTLKEWCLLIDGAEPSTNKTAQKGPNKEAESIEWWHETDAPHAADLPRNIAYLVAYLEFHGPVLPMKGLPVHEGWVYPDRAIMRSLHNGGYISDDGPNFVLTETGRALIAPWLVQDGNHFRRTTGTEQKG